MARKRRLRELVLAGGALAAIGCTGTPQTSPQDASVGGGSSSGTTSGSSSSGGGGDGAACCAGSGDPCCPVLTCGAPMTPECACRQDGGAWLPATGACQTGHSTLGCCSNNADPCCPYTEGSDGVCAVAMYPTCACELDGGLWSGPTQSCGFGFDGGGDSSVDADVAD